MQQILNEIKAAKNFRLYHAALALALTLPDICEKVEFPARENDKKGYIDWFDKHIYPKYEPGFIEFNGNACYALRCAVLHSGNLELWENNIVGFKLCIHDHSGSVVIDKCFKDEHGKKTIELNILTLINNLVDAAEGFYNQSLTPEAFENFSYSIIKYL